MAVEVVDQPARQAVRLVAKAVKEVVMVGVVALEKAVAEAGLHRWNCISRQQATQASLDGRAVAFTQYILRIIIKVQYLPDGS